MKPEKAGLRLARFSLPLLSFFFFLLNFGILLQSRARSPGNQTPVHVERFMNVKYTFFIYIYIFQGRINPHYESPEKFDHQRRKLYRMRAALYAFKRILFRATFCFCILSKFSAEVSPLGRHTISKHKLTSYTCAGETLSSGQKKSGKHFFDKSEDEERKVRLRSTEERKWLCRLLAFFCFAQCEYTLTVLNDLALFHHSC